MPSINIPAKYMAYATTAVVITIGVSSYFMNKKPVMKKSKSETYAVNHNYVKDGYVSPGYNEQKIWEHDWNHPNKK